MIFWLYFCWIATIWEQRFFFWQIFLVLVSHWFILFHLPVSISRFSLNINYSFSYKKHSVLLCDCHATALAAWKECRKACKGKEKNCQNLKEKMEKAQFILIKHERFKQKSNIWKIAANSHKNIFSKSQIKV